MRSLSRIAFFGFVLNALWEFGQCTFLYGMWSWEFGKAAVWMWAAIVGDVAIVFGVIFVASYLTNFLNLQGIENKKWLVLLGVGFLFGLVLEWASKLLDLWEYSELMPTVTLLGYTVGLSPVVQITILPALALYLSTHWGIRRNLCTR